MPGGPSPNLLFNGAVVAVVPGSIVENPGAENGPTADVEFQCDWDDRFTVVQFLRGGVSVSGGSYTYLPIASWPTNPNLYCTSLGAIRGVKWRTYQNDSPDFNGTAPAGWGTYELAIIPAHFSVPTWSAPGQTITDPSGLAMTTTVIKPSTEVFVPPNGAFYYQGGTYNGKIVADSSVGLIRSRAEITMVRHMVPYAYLDTIMADLGSVNLYPITIADREFPKGALLFAACNPEPTADPIGIRCWDYACTLIGNYENDWNEVMDPAGAYQLVNTASGGGGDFPFDYTNLLYLFDPSLTGP